MLLISYDILFQNWMLSTFHISVTTIVQIHFDSYPVQSASIFEISLNDFAEVVPIHDLEDLVFAIEDRNSDLFLILI